MLNYKESNPTCVNLLAKNGLTVPDKYTLKAVATMTPSQANHKDGWRTYNACVLPAEAKPSFSSPQCNLIGRYIDETNDCKTTVAFSEFGQGGKTMNLPTGTVYNNLPQDVPEWNDVIRSVCVPAGQVFTAAQHPDFGGQSWVVSGPAAVDIPQYMREGGGMISALRVDGNAIERDPVVETKVYTMQTSKAGLLPLDPTMQQPMLRQGQALYPNDGCLHAVGGDTLRFMKDASSILDYPNQVELYRLRRVISILMADCEELDRQIRIETNLLNAAKSKLATQQALCRQYADDLTRYKAMMAEQMAEKQRNEILKRQLNEQHIETRKSGKTITDRCNADIRHCWAFQHCDFGGRRQKMQGYIPDLVKSGFPDISSLVIPPGIEVRIYDDTGFIGGNALYTAPISGNGLKKNCLINDSYTQRKINVDNSTGSFAISSTYRNWNDNIRGMRVRRSEFYQFTPKEFVETFVDYDPSYSEPVAAGVSKAEHPGNMDSWFYGEVSMSVNKGNQDYLGDFQNKGPMGIVGKSTYTYNVVRNNDFFNNKELTKFFSQQELDGIPAQSCAKWCKEHTGDCDSFVFKKNEKKCNMYKGQGVQVLGNTDDCGNGNGSCTTYVGKGIQAISKPTGRWMMGMDIPFNDITRINVANRDACAIQCALRGECKAMSFNNKGTDCWLKSAAANKRNQPDRDSWVKDGVKVTNAPPPAPKNQQPAPKAQPKPKPAPPQVVPPPKNEVPKANVPPKVAKSAANKLSGKKIVFTIEKVDFYLRIHISQRGENTNNTVLVSAANKLAMEDLVKQGYGDEFKFNITGDGLLYTDAMKKYVPEYGYAEQPKPVQVYVALTWDTRAGPLDGFIYRSEPTDPKSKNEPMNRDIKFWSPTSDTKAYMSGYDYQYVHQFEIKNKRLMPIGEFDKGSGGLSWDKYRYCIGIGDYYSRGGPYDNAIKLIIETINKGMSLIGTDPLEVEVSRIPIDESCDKGCDRYGEGNKGYSTESLGKRQLSSGKWYNYYYTDFQLVTLK